MPSVRGGLNQATGDDDANLNRTSVSKVDIMAPMTLYGVRSTEYGIRSADKLRSILVWFLLQSNEKEIVDLDLHRSISFTITE